MKKQDTSEKAANLVYLSIGSNLGNRIQNIENTKSLILSNNIKILSISSYYETPSWPNSKFPKFLNIVLKINTILEILDLFLLIKNIEKIMGRKINKKNYPRVCDIDIIDFNGENFDMDNLTIPHKRCHQRNFVLFPISQIDPCWEHPILRKNVNVLIGQLDLKSRIEITRLNKNVNINI